MRIQFIDAKHKFLFWLVAGIAISAGLTAGFGTRLVQVAFARSGIQQKLAVPVGAQVAILARDTFRRPDQAFWGTASSGQNWEGDANKLSIFSIVDARGQIRGGQGAVQAILGPISVNEEVLVSGSVNQFGGQVSLGAVLRWSSANNWYKVLIDGRNLTLFKRVNDVITQLASIPFSAQNHTSYTLRFRVTGTTLLAKVWLSNASEPVNWQIKRKDAALLSGQGGLRVVSLDHTVITVTSFLETQVGASEGA